MLNQVWASYLQAQFQQIILVVLLQLLRYVGAKLVSDQFGESCIQVVGCFFVGSTMIKGQPLELFDKKCVPNTSCAETICRVS